MNTTQSPKIPKIPKFVSCKSSSNAFKRGNGKRETGHGDGPNPTNKEHAFMKRVCDELGGGGDELRIMDNDVYGLLSRHAFTEKIIVSKDAVDLINGMLHALEQCAPSDAVAENKELFKALLPVPNQMEILFVRYKEQWEEGDVEDVAAMLSGNDEVMNLVPIMLGCWPEDAQLEELYERLFVQE